MKKALNILLALLVLASAAGVATAQVQQQKCPTCGKPYSECPYKFKHPVSSKKCPTCGKTIDKCQYNGKHPAPPKKCSTCGKTLDKCQYVGKHPAKCSTCGKTVDTCQYGGKHPKCSTCGEVIEKCQYNGKHPSEQELRRERVLRELEANMVKIKGGTFTMGNYPKDDVAPTHQVTLSDFYICKYEVTQELWLVVMESNPSYFSAVKGYAEDLQRPVERVSWEDCQTFIDKLNQLTGKNYRLPTEAEWEYAARGGNLSLDFKYSGSNIENEVIWSDSNSNGTSHPVGTKAPNELGLYDMSGNVWEWCSDWYGSYNLNAQTNPKGPTTGTKRVFRGGSWYDNIWKFTLYYRNYASPSWRNYGLGLRLAL